MTLERGVVFSGILFDPMQVRLPVAKSCPQPILTGGEIMPKVKVREKIISLLKRKKLSEWTVEDLAELGISRAALASCQYTMKNSGLIRDTGETRGQMKLWAWPHPKHAESPSAEIEITNYHVIGEQVISILRRQDAQIQEDTTVINGLTEVISKLQAENMELTERINTLTNGRVTTKELSDMNRRATLQ